MLARMSKVRDALTRPLPGPAALALPAWLRRLAPGLPALAVLAALFGLDVSQTPDSAQYLRAAETFRLTGSLGNDYLHWPPLYPVLLAAHGSMAITTFAALLGNLGALATLLGAWMLGRRMFASPVTLALALLALVSVARFGTVFSHVWSEVVFVPLGVWLAYAWVRYLDEGKGLPLACVLLALALLSRHVGVVMDIDPCAASSTGYNGGQWR